jgi:hypothetical protein
MGVRLLGGVDSAIEGDGCSLRYYVVETSEDSKAKMYIVAEVVHEVDENSDDRASGLAGQIAGTNTLILSDAEIGVMDNGARMLRDWDAGDDQRYDAENERILSEDGREATVFPRLRLVKALKTRSLPPRPRTL